MTTPQNPTDVHLALPRATADWEVGYLAAHLRSLDGGVTTSGLTVRTVGLTADPVTTMGGLRVLPDLVLGDLRPDDSAMLVLPGGTTWDDPQNGAFVAAARTFLDAGRPVAAICGAVFALASAGLLDHRAHTSNHAGWLASSGYAGGEHYRREPAVVDGDLVTASGVAPVHFARAIFDRLGAHDPARVASWAKLYADRDPAGFFELMA